MRRLAALLLVAAACSPGAEDPATPNGDQRGRGLIAHAANYELLVADDNRLIVGLLTQDNLFVSGGTVTFRLAYLDEGTMDPGESLTAGFLPLAEPGTPPPPPEITVGPASIGRGVYAARPVSFDRAGIWQAEVEAVIDGETRVATTTFAVYEEPLVPGVGERAPKTENLTIHSEDAPPEAVDSRAGVDGEIPFPELHDTTIAEAIDAGRPALAVFATPVYCISKFCGPITDMVAGLQEEYGDRAEFIHVEIWRDFQGQVINRAAAEWLLRDDDLREPWIFLIGADGRIVARWDNVATPEEIAPLLEELPRIG